MIPQKLKETKQLQHNRIKEISYSKKVKIKENNTHRTQVEEDYSDSI
jgi:hypothetical protein